VRYPLYKDTLSIGRTGDNDIQIRTHYVSRNHARIVIRDGEAIIEDLDSKNGVFLNALRVTSEALKSGDRLTIGETEFRYLVAPPRSN
jgi:pSer/pThr/pTyr-binding forkhead associated (FHA) protein